MNDGRDEPRAPGMRLTTSELEVVEVGRGRWRVVRRGRPADDEGRLLGYIEQHVDRFEVLQIGALATRTRFTTWDDAFERIAETGATLADERARLGIRWRM